MSTPANTQFDFIDILTVFSLVLQLQNQEHLIDINDVQDEVNRAVDTINLHLEEQDRKLKLLLEREKAQ